MDNICLHCGNSSLENCFECTKRLGHVNFEPKIMSLNQYQEATSRTDSHTFVKEALNNFAFGIMGESGEVVDLIKKVLFHGHPIDKEKFKAELGDVMWYVARIAQWAGLSLEEVAQGNIDKLKKRYPDGFSKEKSINREEESK